MVSDNSLTETDILNQPLPATFKIHCTFLDQPTNRGDWAKQIWSFIEAIEEGYCRAWDDERLLKILDDCYAYCDAYGFVDIRKQIVDLRNRFKIHADPTTELNVDMNYLRSFFHDEWFNPLNNSWSDPTEC